MKKITPYLMLLLMLLTLTSNSCDEDILDVDISTEITRSIDLHVNQGKESIIENYTVDLNNDDTKDYINKIKNVTITKLSYKIKNFSGDPEGTISGTVSVEDFSFEPIVDNIKNAFDSNTEYKISNENELSTIAELLKEKGKITVEIDGESECPNNSMDFTIEVTAKLKITANPL